MKEKNKNRVNRHAVADNIQNVICVNCRRKEFVIFIPIFRFFF